MSAINTGRARRGGGKRRAEDGVAAVEFAVVAMLFFLIVFGIIEVARAMYIYNTLAEVTRGAARAAANIDFRDQSALDAARRHAVFDDAGGILPFGQPVTSSNIRIDYLYLNASAGAEQLQPIPAGAMPTCPARNRVNCMANPASTSCIRAVQARVCLEGQSTGACTPVTYQAVIPLVGLALKLPLSTTIVSAETLGYHSGDTPCP